MALRSSFHDVIIYKEYIWDQKEIKWWKIEDWNQYDFLKLIIYENWHSTEYQMEKNPPQFWMSKVCINAIKSK